MIVWEDHWYDPDGETTPQVAQAEGPKEMMSVGLVVSETEKAVQLALDYSGEARGTFRHHAFYDKRMIKEIIEMRPYKSRKKAQA